MDELPALFLKNVFQYLNQKESIRCSLVCRKWKLAYDLFKPTSLCAYFHHFPYGKRCSYTNSSIAYECSFEIEHFQFFQHEFTRKYFQDIKKLIIFEVDYFAGNGLDGFEFEALNYFDRLEHLELIGLTLHYRDAKLGLPELRILDIRNNSIHKFRFELDTPKLEVLLSSSDVSKFKIHHPNSLKHLETSDLKNVFYDADDADKQKKFRLNRKFLNLQCLVFRSRSGTVHEKFIEDFVNLKLLIWTGDEENLNQIDEELERQRSMYNLGDLRIVNYNKAFQISRTNGLLIKFAKKSLPFNLDVQLSANQLGLSKEMFDKCFQIKELYIGSRVDDQMKLVELCKGLGYLKKLSIKNCHLDQGCLNQLSKCLSVGHLEVDEQLLLNDLNLDFIGKFKIYKITFFFDYNAVDVQSVYSFIGRSFENQQLKIVQIDSIPIYCEIKKRKTDFVFSNYVQNSRNSGTRADFFSNNLDEILRAIDDNRTENLAEFDKDGFISHVIP